MKKGISIWAFKDHSHEECFEIAARNGYEGVELSLDAVGPISVESTDADIAAVKRSAENAGISLYSLATGLYWNYNMVSESAATRQKALDIALKQLDTAAKLGASTILLIPGMVGSLSGKGEKVNYETAYKRAEEALMFLAPEAEKYGVEIGIENVWNKFLLSPLEMKNLIDSIGSKYVGSYFDVGNCLRDGFPEQWIEILGSRIKKVHFKDFKLSIGTINGFVDLLEGDVNYPAVMDALRKTGYDGWVTAEIFPYANCPDAMITASSAAMDAILKL